MRVVFNDTICYSFSLFAGWGDLNMRVVSRIQYVINFLCFRVGVT